MFKSLTDGSHRSVADRAKPVCTKEKKRKKKENRGTGSPARRTHRRGLSAAAATGRRGKGSGEARGGELPAVGMITGGGEAWSSSGVVDRGGRDAVEDGDGDSGQQSPGRVRPRVHGVLGRLGVEGIGEEGSS